MDIVSRPMVESRTFGGFANSICDLRSVRRVPNHRVQSCDISATLHSLQSKPGLSPSLSAVLLEFLKAVGSRIRPRKRTQSPRRLESIPG
jgi:hypothetical protein